MRFSVIGPDLLCTSNITVFVCVCVYVCTVSHILVFWYVRVILGVAVELWLSVTVPANHCRADLVWLVMRFFLDG